MTSLDTIAECFVTSFYKGTWPDNPSFDLTELSTDDAYRVQDLVSEIRFSRGEKLVGYKVGCTSAAIRAQFGLGEPIHARLYHPHVFEEDTDFDLATFRNCAIEPKMVLRIGHDLHGENLSDDELAAGIDSVSPGIELHHLMFWQQPTTLQGLTGSGGILAGLVVGSSRVSPERLTFIDEVFRVFKDGDQVAAQSTSEIMGGLLHYLRWLVSALVRKGKILSAVSVVTPGSTTELIDIGGPTDFEINIESVGRCRCTFR